MSTPVYEQLAEKAKTEGGLGVRDATQSIAACADEWRGVGQRVNKILDLALPWLQRWLVARQFTGENHEP